MDKIRVFEGFSGVGSQRMALKNIGLNCEYVGIMEVDKYAILAYDAIHNNNEQVEHKTKEEMLEYLRQINVAYNFSTMKDEMPKKEEDIRKLYEACIRSCNLGDITKIDTDKMPDFDFFTYSFPCKNISIAGKQAGLEKDSGTQSALVWECEKIIKAKMPKYLMMENVKNLCGTKHMPFFQEWIDLLSELGYNSYWKVYNGKDFGVPQNRERIIMISIRKDIDEKDFVCPSGARNKTKLFEIMEKDVDSKYYIDSSKVNFTGTFLEKYEDEIKLNQVGMLNVKGNESNRRVYDSNGLCPTINSMNGGNRQPKIALNNLIIDDTQGFDKDENGVKRPRLYEDYAPSLRAMRSGLKTFDSNLLIRKLVPIECWRLMGYKDEDYYKAEQIAKLPNSKLYERTGRGIVVPMLEEIFKETFKKQLKGEM